MESFSAPAGNVPGESTEELPGSRPAFRDLALPPDDRVSDLIARLTLDEKLALLHQYMPAVPRLGLAEFRTGTEVLHGVAWLGTATVFPQAVGLGATWNPELLAAIGSAVGAEVRAKHRQDRAVGLNVWGPVVNLLRDPRWGRNEEGYSEDPHLTTVLATAYCQGLRGGPGRPAPLRTAPTLKHFLAYNHEDERDSVSAGIRPRVLWEYDIRPFEGVIGAGAASAVMPGYNKVNERPCHVGSHLRILRSWQPDLAVVSDAWGPIGLVDYARYYDDRPHAYAAALKAGLDSFTCERTNTRTVEALGAALDLGLIEEADIDAAARRMLRLRLDTGEFDRPQSTPAPAPATEDTADRPGHRELAREAARQAVVLLHNDHGTLPLTPARVRTIAVCGVHAGQVFRDWYSGTPPYEITPLDGLRSVFGDDAVEFAEGLDRVTLDIVPGSGALGTDLADGGGTLGIAPADGGPHQCFDLVEWGEGSVSLRSAADGRYLTEREDGLLVIDSPGPEGWRSREVFRLLPHEGGVVLLGLESGRFLAAPPDGPLAMTAGSPQDALHLRLRVLRQGARTVADAAARADAVVVCVGTHPLVGGREGVDRRDLGLAPAQREQIRAALSANPRTVVVLVSGHPVTEPELLRAVPAALWTSHAGQEAGAALADVLTGAHDPAGRLPQTWYRTVRDLGDIAEYDIIKHRKTYLYFPGEVLYPFGHGLSYTRFSFGAPRLGSPTGIPGGRVEVHVEVANSGDVEGAEVVQLYAHAPDARIDRPLRQLLAFRRVRLPPGARTDVAFSVPVNELAYWDVAHGRRRVEPGRYRLMVGRSVADIVGEAVLTVPGPPPPTRDVTNSLVRAADFDDYEDVRLVDETKADGDAVLSGDDGGILLFRRCNLPAGPGQFVARVAGRPDDRGTVEVRLDDPRRGPLLARVTVPTGGWTTVKAPTATVTSGVHDVCLRLSGATRLASFALAAGPGNSDPTEEDL